MRIAVLASNFIRLPPEPLYVPKGRSGASEYIMYVITETLVRRGHGVTLFASGDSSTSARLVSVTPSGTVLDPHIGPDKHIDYEYLLISRCYEMANSGAFDIIHSIFDVRSAVFAQFSHVPTVSTLHSPLVGTHKDILSKIPHTQWYVSVSDAQRIPLPNLRYAGTVYHGIDVGAFPQGDGAGNYLMLAGRMLESKGIDIGVKAALKAKKPLYLLGEPREGDPYWTEKIAGYIDGVRVKHEGFIEKEKLVAFYANASAFLFPIQWEEPFGLVMIEAMACGTPVIAYNRGSVPEIVKDGVTGFIIDPDNADRPGKGTWSIKKQGIDGLVEAVGRIGEIDRRACRRHVEEHFTVEKMVEGYERVYEKVLSTSHTK
jgi:glycosyltransferase involved in cell wall biosynthesis